MDTITLRDVALRLEKLKNPKSKAIADGPLLSLLKSGELKAGFDFPGRPPRWIPIAPDYWSKIGSDRFRSIRKGEGTTFKVSIGGFVDEYSHLFFDDLEKENLTLNSSNESIKNKFKIALAAASQEYEVVVHADEWEKYLARRGVGEPAFKGRGGRNPLAAWRDLSVIIAAYLLAHQAKSQQPVKYGMAADEIFRIAKKTGIDANSIPKPDTIKDVISQIDKMQATILEP